MTNEHNKNDSDSLDFITEVQKSFKKIIDFGRGKCCVCHHDIDDHIDEGNFWRCHSLGADTYQCECNLSKDKAKDNVNFYDGGFKGGENSYSTIIL